MWRCWPSNISAVLPPPVPTYPYISMTTHLNEFHTTSRSARDGRDGRDWRLRADVYNKYCSNFSVKHQITKVAKVFGLSLAILFVFDYCKTIDSFWGNRPIKTSILHTFRTFNAYDEMSNKSNTSIRVMLIASSLLLVFVTQFSSALYLKVSRLLF